MRLGVGAPSKLSGVSSQAAADDAPQVPKLLRLALAGDRRDRRLAAATAGLMLHQAGEAAVPILIGVIIDRAIAPGDSAALLLWLGVLGAVFLLLSLSYQRSALAMVGVYGYGEHDLRQLTAARVLHPRGIRSRRHAGEVLSIATSDTGRVAGISWSIAQQAATLAAVVAVTSVLIFISVSARHRRSDWGNCGAGAHAVAREAPRESRGGRAGCRSADE